MITRGKLTRFCNSPYGVFSSLMLYDHLDQPVSEFAVGELPWKQNQRKTSCIPAGLYTLKRYHSPKHGEVWEVTDVPNRSAILIHIGNVARDVEGCLFVGERFGALGNSWAVLSSRVGVRRLMALTQDAPSWILEIVWDGNPESH